MESCEAGMTISLFTKLTSEELYGAGIVRLAHGLLVVSSTDSVDSHDGWDPTVDPIHAGPDSIYVSAQQAASGPVAVACVAGPVKSPGLDLLHSGEIELSRPTISIYDPNGAMSLNLPVDEKKNVIDIYGDGGDESGQLLIALRGISG
jgi:hypothetical protein